MNRFYAKDVNTDSRDDMVKFLSNHFRYYTTNSWNQSTSYANNVKIYNMHLSKLEDKVYEMLDISEVQERISDIIDIFNKEYNYSYQAKFNGRSDGYLVLYKGSKIESDYKSRCENCGQFNFKTVEESNNVCGYCRAEARVNITKPIYNICVYPGKNIDQNENFEEWEDSELKERCELLCRFDRLCDEIRDFLINAASEYDIETEEVEETIITTEKVLKKKGGVEIEE